MRRIKLLPQAQETNVYFIDAKSSVVEISESILLGGLSLGGLSAVDTLINIFNSTFSNFDKGVFSSLGSPLFLSNVTFEENYNRESSGVITIRDANIEIFNCSFIDNNALQQSANMVATSSTHSLDLTAVIANTIFISKEIIPRSHASITNFGNVQILNSSFIYENDPNTPRPKTVDAGLEITTSDLINITKTVFQGILDAGCLAILGPAASTDSNPKSNRSAVQVAESSFSNCNSIGSGGGLMLQDVIQANLTSNVFTNNYAGISGGAIYYDCDDPSSYVVLLGDNHFINNQAEESGGALHSAQKEIQIEPDQNNTFENNSAPYGKDVASIPAILDLSNSFATRRMLQVGGVSYPFIQSQSGAPLPKMVIELKDNMKQLMTQDNVSRITLEYDEHDGRTVRFVNPVARATNGIISMTDAIFIGNPGESFILTLVFDSRLYPELNISTKVWVKLRNCELGEELATETCNPCPPGRFSVSNRSECKTCPENMDCSLGKDILKPIQNYWHAPRNSTLAVMCAGEDACKTNETTGESYCAEGYSGNLCRKCDKGRGEEEEGSCTLCSDQLSTKIQYAVAKLVLFILICYQLSKIMESDEQFIEKGVTAIVQAHIRTLSIISQFQSKWGTGFDHVFQFSQEISGVASNSYGNACLFGELFGYDNTLLSRNVFITLTTPIFFVIISLFWMARRMYYRKRGTSIQSPTRGSRESETSPLPSENKHQFLTIFLFVVNYFYPLVITQSISNMQCLQISSEDPKKYLVIAPYQECWEGLHRLIFYLFTIPSLVLFGFCFPLVCFVALIQQQRKLKMSDSVKNWTTSFSFLSTNYRTDRIYWPAYVYIENILKVSLARLLVSYDVATRATIALLFCVITYLSYRGGQPYFKRELNNLAIFSQLAITLTSAASVLSFDSTFTLASFIGSGAVNAAFFIQAILLFAKAKRDIIAKKLEKKFPKVTTLKTNEGGDSPTKAKLMD